MRQKSKGIRRESPYGQIDNYLLICVCVLCLFGLVMILSASYYSDQALEGDAFLSFGKQLQALTLGIPLMLVFMVIPYHFWFKFSALIYLGSLLLLYLPFTALGEVRNNSARWINLFGYIFQPSEFVKLGIVIFLAHYLNALGRNIAKLIPLLFLLLIIGVLVALVIAAPDLSTGISLLGVSLIMIFVAGANGFHLTFLGLGAYFIGPRVLEKMGYWQERIEVFRDPWAHKLGNGWQIIQSLVALDSGGSFGVGIGQSTQKLLYIPFPQNDFIFAIIVEEVGFFGGALLIGAFSFFVYRGVKIAINSIDKKGALLAIGIVSVIGIQVFINVGVVINFIPATGVNLPFISAGGSSLISYLMMSGILLSISRESKSKKDLVE